MFYELTLKEKLFHVRKVHALLTQQNSASTSKPAPPLPAQPTESAPTRFREIERASTNLGLSELSISTRDPSTDEIDTELGEIESI